MAKQMVMNIAELKKLLNEIGNEVSDDYQVWLSSDEDGNEFLSMPENTEFEFCLAIDKDEKKDHILFHRTDNNNSFQEPQESNDSFFLPRPHFLAAVFITS
jgi:hypothetical protein